MSQPSSRRSFDPARLEAYIKNAGLSYRPTSKSFIFTCPKCGKEDKLWIFRHSGNFVCFVCRETESFSGSAEWALTLLTGQSVAEIRRELYGIQNYQSSTALILDFGDGEDEDEEIEDEPELAEVEWPYDCYSLDHKWSKNGLLYLEGRGIDAELAEAYQIRYCPPRRSVAFPVYVGTKLVGWQYRIIDPEKVTLEDGTVATRLKTISDAGEDEDFPRDRVVMFQNRLVAAKAAVVCEGPVDAIKAHLVGGNIATMGKAISDAQIDIIKRSGVSTIYLALDPDAASEITPLMFRFGPEVEFRRVRVPKQFKDLGAMTVEQARDAILSAPVVEPAKELELYFKGEDLVFPNPLG